MSALPSTPAFYSARPVLLVDGADQPELADGVLSLMVEETTAGLYRCEITLGNWGAKGGEVGYLYLDRRLLDFGKALEVRMGVGETAATVFEGRIMGLEGRFPQTRPPELTVLAEDRLQDLRMTRRTRSFEDVTDEAIFRQVASDHNLTPRIDVDASVTHKAITQVNQSDLAFLRERARAIDAEVWVKGEELRVASRGRREGSEIALTYGQRLREFSVLADLAGQRTSVTVSGWDVAAKEPIDVRVDDAAIRSDLQGEVAGGPLLRQAFGERAEQIVHHAPESDQEARAIAEAYYRRAARRFVTGRGTSEGDGRLTVGSKVVLSGLDPIFNGAYDVVEARHLFDEAQGYRTEFRVERPWLGV